VVYAQPMWAYAAGFWGRLIRRPDKGLLPMYGGRGPWTSY
jgi:hypothetical protein